MPLCTLLFSGRPETSGPLVQALLELDLSIEHAAEIFAAIRELTSRSFDLIVIDLEDGPEAEFLLRTARELRINHNAFVLAVAPDANTTISPSNRADLVLTKPLVPEQIKYSLLDCDRFLVAYMRGGMNHDDPVPRSTAALERKASAAIVLPALHQPTSVPRR
jgi:CheY-like chemotaxis protein